VLVEEDNGPFTYIKESTLLGLGLFAGKSFDINEIIIDYRPFYKSFYKVKWSELLPQQYNKNWVIPVDDEYCLTNNKSNKIHFINHSRQPNCDWDIKGLLVLANRFIEKDEELLIDYRTEYRPNRDKFPHWI